MSGEPKRLDHSPQWDCSEPRIGGLLAAYEWGLLGSNDEERFEEHLLECAGCAAELSTTWMTGEVLREARRPRRRFAWLPIGLAAAAAVLFVIVEVGNRIPTGPGQAGAPIENPESSGTAAASWTFELDVPNSSSFTYDLDIPGAS